MEIPFEPPTECLICFAEIPDNKVCCAFCWRTLNPKVKNDLFVAWWDGDIETLEAYSARYRC